MAKRRANGEGSIRKRKDGRWEGRYTAGRDPETGRAITKNVLAKTQKECKEKLKQALEASEKVDLVKAEKYTVAQWCRLWYENYCKPTVWQIQRCIENHYGNGNTGYCTIYVLFKFLRRITQ